MIIYVLKRNIDGYGGLMKDLYFNSYEKAKEALMKTSCLYFSDEENKWYVEGMKECRWHEEDNSFSLLGIQYPKEEQDEWSIFWCRVSIEPIELDFDTVNNEIFLLKYCKGYTDWLYRGIDGIENTDGEADKPSILKYCRSNKQARKFAARNKNWKRIARLWVRPEEEKRISALGYGQNYLSIEKVEIA